MKDLLNKLFLEIVEINGICQQLFDAYESKSIVYSGSWNEEQYQRFEKSKIRIDLLRELIEKQV